MSDFHVETKLFDPKDVVEIRIPQELDEEVYDIEVYAVDEFGNRSAPTVLRNVRVVEPPPAPQVFFPVDGGVIPKKPRVIVTSGDPNYYTKIKYYVRFIGKSAAQTQSQEGDEVIDAEIVKEGEG